MVQQINARLTSIILETVSINAPRGSKSELVKKTRLSSIKRLLGLKYRIGSTFDLDEEQLNQLYNILSDKSYVEGIVRETYAEICASSSIHDTRGMLSSPW